MRTKIETTDVYTFDELEQSAQQKALERLCDINIDDKWFDCALDEFAAILNTIGVDCSVKDIIFSGFSSQGDGLSFTGNYRYQKGALAAIKKEYPTWTALHTLVAELQEVQRRAFYRVEGRLLRTSSYYCHEKTVTFDVPWETEAIYPDAEERFTKIFRALMQEFYFRLQAEYDYLVSKEAIIEAIESNGYEFTIDGRLA